MSSISNLIHTPPSQNTKHRQIKIIKPLHAFPFSLDLCISTHRSPQITEEPVITGRLFMTTEPEPPLAAAHDDRMRETDRREREARRGREGRRRGTTEQERLRR
ncbi:hypothetical protein Hanom_Chr08g00737821 [Helianthus anomalus]